MCGLDDDACHQFVVPAVEVLAQTDCQPRLIGAFGEGRVRVDPDGQQIQVLHPFGVGQGEVIGDVIVVEERAGLSLATILADPPVNLRRTYQRERRRHWLVFELGNGDAVTIASEDCVSLVRHLQDRLPSGDVRGTFQETPPAGDDPPILRVVSSG
jgi:hypothetical protein